MSCPLCTWSCVMVAEDQMPEGVRKLVEGVPWCPNDDVPMEPIASVEPKTNGATLPATVMAAAVGEDVPIEKRLEIIRQAQTDVDGAKARWARAAETAKDLKKEWDGKVETLGAIIRRLTQVPAPLPLFDAPPTDVATTVMEANAAAEFHALSARLEVLGFTATVSQLDAMDLETYQAVTAFVEARENGGTVAVPECLMAPADEPQEHEDALEPPRSRRRRRGQDEASA